MGINTVSYVLIAFSATVVGSVPFGPVNLTVVNLSIHKSLKKGMEFAFAAALIEILIAISAINFGKYIEQFFEENTWIKILIFTTFIVLGIFNLVRKTHPKLNDKTKFKVPEFVKGVIISIINPQVIIFWIFALTFITQEFKPNFTTTHLIVFLSSVFLTKLGVLYAFGKGSSFLKTRLKESCKLINRVMGTVLLIIGLIQAFNYFIVA